MPEPTEAEPAPEGGGVFESDSPARTKGLRVGRVVRVIDAGLRASETEGE